MQKYGDNGNCVISISSSLSQLLFVFSHKFSNYGQNKFSQKYESICTIDVTNRYKPFQVSDFTGVGPSIFSLQHQCFFCHSDCIHTLIRENLYYSFLTHTHNQDPLDIMMSNFQLYGTHNFILYFYFSSQDTSTYHNSAHFIEFAIHFSSHVQE